MTITYKLIIFSVLILIPALILSIYNSSFNNFLKYYFNNDLKSNQKSLFTTTELAEYDGLVKPDLFLSLLGIIYNVTKGADHYEVGKPYHVFVGKDGSRSFLTGKFDGGQVSDDVASLSLAEIYSLNHWIKFYRKKYKQVGKLIGRYYDENGRPTPYNKQVRKLIKEAEAEKRNQDLDNVKFPACNVEWDVKLGKTRIWCSKKSGGIERSWVGFPRQLYLPGANAYRCACVNEENLSLSNIREYQECDPKLDTCIVKM